MEMYNVFVDYDGCLDHDLVGKTLTRVLKDLGGELIVVNTLEKREDIVRRFPDDLGLKVVTYDGTPMGNFCHFCEMYPQEWNLLVLPRRQISPAVEVYKKFWHGEMDSIFIPTSEVGFSSDLSGHLMFFNSDIAKKLDPCKNLDENLHTLASHGIKFKGIHGVCWRRIHDRKQSSC